MEMGDKIPRVTVLLATFNGVKFLDQQLNSLTGQHEVEVEVYANDDGSTDGTVDLLEIWKETGLIKKISRSNQIGSSQAFLNLLKLCNEKSFVAFCDQDDVWEARKLITQINQVTNDKPMAVASKRSYINVESHMIGISPNLRFKPCFENAIVENITPGNTILINRKSVELINSFKTPQISHYDSWIYLLVSVFGDVIHIQEPLTRYRIHSNNTVGLRKINFNRHKAAVKSFVSQSMFLHESSPKNFNAEQQNLLNKYVKIHAVTGMFRKIFLIWKLPIRRQRRLDQIGFKVILLLLMLRNDI
jgi:glycosyltransferase involved in cell wall biosynthesis